MTTLLDLRNEIKDDLVITGTAYDAQIDSKIRSALRLLRGKRLWFLKDTETISSGAGITSTSLSVIPDLSVAGTFEISVNSQWRKDGEYFDHLSFERLKDEHWNSSPVTTGPPIACAVLNGSLYYSHTTDASYSVRVTYYKQDATLPTQDADTSVWFDEGYSVVMDLAKYLFKRGAQNVSASEDGGDIADTFLRGLYEKHQAYDSGRV